MTLASQWPRSVSGVQPDERQPPPRAAGLDGVTPSEPEEQAGPILITYNGLPAALRAPVLATRVLAERRTPLVVWRRGLGRELLEVPPVPGLPPARIDIRAAKEIDEARAETARRIDRTVGAIARGAGSETEVLAVAELPQIAVLETIVRVACERDCCAGLVAARAPLVTARSER